MARGAAQGGGEGAAAAAQGVETWEGVGEGKLLSLPRADLQSKGRRPEADESVLSTVLVVVLVQARLGPLHPYGAIWPAQAGRAAARGCGQASAFWAEGGRSARLVVR